MKSRRTRRRLRCNRSGLALIQAIGDGADLSLTVPASETEAVLAAKPAERAYGLEGAVDSTTSPGPLAFFKAPVKPVFVRDRSFRR